MVPSVPPFRRRCGLTRIAIQPLLYHVVIELLGPQYSAKTLPHNILGIIGKIVWDDGRIEVIGLSLASGEGLIKWLESSVIFEFRIAKTQTNNNGLPRPHNKFVVCGGFCPSLLRVHSIVDSLDDVVVDAIFHIRSRIV